MAAQIPPVSLSTALGVEQGVLAILSTKTTEAFSRVAGTQDLVLLSLALLSLARNTPRLPVVGRLSDLTLQLYTTIALNLISVAVTVPGEQGVSLLNLLAVFFLSNALQHEGLSMASQYVLSSSIASVLMALDSQALMAAWALAFVPHVLSIDPALEGVAQMVAATCIINWVALHLPPDTLIPSLLILLYLLTPFFETYTVFARLYRYTVYAVSGDSQLKSVPTWALAVGMWVAWRVKPDRLSTSLSVLAGSHFVVVMVLDSLQEMMQDDLLLVTGAFLIFLNIMLENLPRE